MKLNYKRTILVGFAFFLISAFWQAYDAIVPLILTNHYGLSQTVSGTVMSLDNILAVFLLPIFGAISDKIMTRLGRRTPFIIVGTVAAVISFIFLAVMDAAQLSRLADEGIVDAYNATKAALDSAREAGNEALVALHEEGLEKIAERVHEITLGNLWPVVGFIGVLLVVLLSMAIFRSPAVALMPDVTVKPLRSKGNAIINLMGAAGGILVLALGIVFGTSKNLYMSYVGYVLAVIGIMVAGLVVFVLTVKEKTWAQEMEAESERLGIEERTESDGSEKKKLSRPELISLMLILASVALWYIGYNSITSKYSVYATNILGFDYNATLIVAQAAAIVSYIPVGIVSSKFGRRKTILAGVAMLATAFLLGYFITPNVHPLVMYPIFMLAGIGWATINVNSFPMVVELARGGDVGKYTGYYYTASMAAQIIAPILSGALYDLLGMRHVFFTFGTVFVALSFVTMFFVKHGDAKPEKQDALEALAGAED
ncbi:MAG: MFS transporter [Clostridia bacterium]|nr:MFS transporter [Clostridia bacterium]